MGWVSKSFYTYGRLMTWYPFIGIIVFIGLGAVLSGGLLFLNVDSSPDSLWVNPNSKITQEMLDYQATYGGYYRIENMIFSFPRNASDELQDSSSDAGNIFTKEYLYEVYYLQNVIMRRSFEYEDENGTVLNITLNDVCEIAVPDSTECTIPSVIGYWQNNFERLYNDSKIQETVQCLYSIDPNNTIPCTDQTGFPILAEEVFGGLSCEGGQEKTACSLCNIKAEAFSTFRFEFRLFECFEPK